MNKQIAPHTLREIKASFEANNITFNTSFLVLFALGMQIGAAVFWIPIGFCVGIVFYAWKLLPRHLVLLKETGHISSVFIYTKHRHIKFFIAFAVLLSYVAYASLEIQGFRAFSESILPLDIGQEWGLVLLLLMIALYAAQGGWNAVFKTDRYQLWLIYLGTGALYLLGILVLSSGLVQFPSLMVLLKQFLSQPWLGVQMILGFFFAQLIYYENWMRLEYLLHLQVDIQAVGPVLQRSLLWVALGNMLVFAAPIFMALLAREYPENMSASLLRDVLSSFSDGMGLRIILALVMIQALAAIASTLDTFALSAAQLCLPLQFRSKKFLGLGIGLFLMIAYGVSRLPVDVTGLYLITSFGLNMFIGPILLCLFTDQKPSKTRLELLFGGALCLIFMSLYLHLEAWLGVILLAYSLALFPFYLDTRNADSSEQQGIESC